MYLLYFDGLYRQITISPSNYDTAGLLCYGWILFKHAKMISRGLGGYMRSKDTNSSVAEYLGLIEGLEAITDLGLEEQPITICGDAKTIIEQMQGISLVSASSVRPLYRHAYRIASRFNNLEWIWMPRKQNHEADALTRRAIHQIRANSVEYQKSLNTIKQQINSRKRSNRFYCLFNLSLYLKPATPA